jgi:hypothetical protein
MKRIDYITAGLEDATRYRSGPGKTNGTPAKWRHAIGYSHLGQHFRTDGR